MKSVLITGGAGYIGSYTVRELLKQGYYCVVVDNLSNGHLESLYDSEFKNDQKIKSKDEIKKLLSGVDFYQVDIRDRSALRAVFEKHNISGVIHLAGLAIVEESFHREAEYFDCNVNGTEVILSLCRDFAVRNFVFSSSSTVYGDANAFEKLTEQHVVAPMNPYGQSKLFCEEKIKEWAESINSTGAKRANFICLRYFNVAGASADLSNGPRGNGSGRLIFNITKAAVHSEKTQGIIVNGRDYPTQDGTCVRDYIHVEDIADIHVRSLEYLLKTSDDSIRDLSGTVGGLPGSYSQNSSQNRSVILNCGYGEGFSVQQIIENYQKYNQVQLNIEWGPRRSGDPAYLVGDSTQLVSVLGWKSRFANPLESICRSAYEWGKHSKNSIEHIKK